MKQPETSTNQGQHLLAGPPGQPAPGLRGAAGGEGGMSLATGGSAVWAIVVKDLRLLLRDKSAFFFTFIFPIGFAIFFGIIFGGDGGVNARMKVLLVDEDRTPASDRLAQRLTSASELGVEVTPDAQEARRRVLKREAVAFVRVPQGFQEASRGLMWGAQASIDVGVDPSRTAERGMLMGVLQKYAFMGLSDSFNDPALAREQLSSARTLMRDDKGVSTTDRLLFEAVFASVDRLVDRGPRSGSSPAALSGQRAPSEPGRSDAAKPAGPAGPAETETADGDGGFTPIKITFTDVKPPRVGPSNPFAISSPQGIIWGLMGAAMGFAASFVGERTGGTLARLRASPLPASSLLMGKALACYITTLAASVGILGVGALMGVSLSNWPTLLLGVASVCVGFTGLMMLIAAVAPTERAASGVGWAALMVLGFIGGAAVPTFAMPGWLQSVSAISPMRWAMQALEGGVWRGYTPTEPAMLLPVGIMLGLGVFGLVVGAWSLRRHAA